MIRFHEDSSLVVSAAYVVRIKQYSASESMLKAFVILQSFEHNDELTADVIKPVCTGFGLDAV